MRARLARKNSTDVKHKFFLEISEFNVANPRDSQRILPINLLTSPPETPSAYPPRSPWLTESIYRWKRSLAFASPPEIQQNKIRLKNMERKTKNKWIFKVKFSPMWSRIFAESIHLWLCRWKLSRNAVALGWLSASILKRTSFKQVLNWFNRFSSSLKTGKLFRAVSDAPSQNRQKWLNK